jgi:hypothetical protein
VRALLGLQKTKAFFSPAPLEIAETAEKDKNLFLEWHDKVLPSAFPAASAREKFFHYFGL